MVSLSAGKLIYLGAMPLVKTYLTIGFGFIMARWDLFPAVASRGASHITMNLALPCLVFANIVPAFTPSNVSALGPLFLLGFIYQFLGFLLGLFIREVCYVPRNFYQGLVVLCTTSNWGNLPTAVVLSVTQVAPFNAITDPDLGVSFVSIFIVAYFLGFWVSGAAHSISWDYLPHVPQGEAAEQKVPWKEKPLGRWFHRTVLKHDTITPAYKPREERDTEKNEIDKNITTSALNSGNQLERRLSNTSKIASPETTTQDTAADAAPVASAISEELPPESPSTSVRVPPFKVGLHRLRQVLSVLATPVTVVLAISIPIALIQPLKALFVDTTAQGGPDWKGPDGRPPLFFIIDTATFVGNLTVPMGLILLGASFARLKLPHPLSRLPWVAMIAVTIAKMVVMPVFGIFVVQAMVKNGLISVESKAERFVAIFLAGTPAAVNQMIATQLYSPDGTVDTLSAFILIQYVFMFIGSSALAAIAIALL